MKRPPINQQLREEDRYKFQLFFFFTSLAIPAFLGISSYHILRKEYWEGFSEGVLALCLGASLIAISLIQHKKIVYLVNVSLVHLFVFHMFFQGGEDGSRMLWMYLLPLISSFWLSKRETLGFMLASYLCTALVFFEFGPLPFGPYAYSPDTKLRFFITFSMVCLLSYGYESLRKQTKQPEEPEKRRSTKRSPSYNSRHNTKKRHSELLREEEQKHKQERVDDQFGESELKRQNDLLRAVMDNAPMAIYAKDQAGNYLFINNKGLDWLGLSADEISGKTDHDLFTPEVAEKSRKEDEDVMHSQSPLTIERSQVLDSEFFAAELHKFPLLSREGEINGVCGITHNVTNHKQSEQQLRQWAVSLEQKLEQYAVAFDSMDQELKNFTGLMPHELKTPLKDINQLTTMLVKNYTNGFDRRGKEIVSLLVNRVKRLNKYLDGIVHYADAGQASEKEQRIDLNELIGEIVEQLVPPPDMQVWIEHELPAIIAGKASMKQIFLHLLSNAINFMDTSYGEIAIDCSEHANYWTFIVADNGPGIDKKYHEKIFRFFQTLAPKDERESAGVGLALVKKLVEGYGGQVWVESAPGKGASFYFTIPKTAS